ncbi:MAG: DapH/DapD/GlmU-related protein [Sulfuriferula sp.]|nr:DapH/DapD/GlmU-related protein [Sulfuriferula sp.]
MKAIFARNVNRFLTKFNNWRLRSKRHSGNEEFKFLPWESVRELQRIEFVTIGRHTYGLMPSSVIRPTKDAPVSVGNFCSFAPGVVILAHANHPTLLPSTYPFKTLFCNLRSETFDPLWPNFDAVTKGAINIGHDVWVGQNAIILSGVTIGNGAVIGAGAVVAKDIPPYAIVVGNPARISRFRFKLEIIEGLEKTQWWHLSDDEIETLCPFFYGDPEKLIEHLLNKKVE